MLFPSHDLQVTKGRIWPYDYGDYNGSSSYMTVNYIPTSLTEITYTWWFRTSTTQSGTTISYHGSTSWGNFRHVLLWGIWATNSLYGRIHTTSWQIVAESTDDWADGKWHHYALRYDTSSSWTVTLFVDGYIAAQIE